MRTWIARIVLSLLALAALGERGAAQQPAQRPMAILDALPRVEAAPEGVLAWGLDGCVYLDDTWYEFGATFEPLGAGQAALCQELYANVLILGADDAATYGLPDPSATGEDGMSPREAAAALTAAIQRGDQQAAVAVLAATSYGDPMDREMVRSLVATARDPTVLPLLGRVPAISNLGRAGLLTVKMAAASGAGWVLLAVVFQRGPDGWKVMDLTAAFHEDPYASGDIFEEGD